MGIGAAVASFLVSGGIGAGVAGVIGGVVQFVAYTAASTLLAKKFQPGGPGLSSRTITSRGTVNPQAIVYGEAVLAGTLAYRNVHGNNQSQLWAVHALCGHEVDSITDIYLDDREILNSIINGGAAGGGGVDSGTFAPTRGTVNTVEIWKHLGTSTQVADANLITADTHGDWTSSHRLRGIAYIVTMFKLNDRTEARWEAGDPSNVKAKVKGKLVYDPRLDSTRVIDSSTSPLTYGSGAHRVDTPSTWEWSDNPALCTIDYMMDSKFSPFPGGIDPDRINWESVADAADDCDTLVFVPPVASPSNTEKRFTCNGVLYGTATPEQNLEALLSSMNGTLVFTGGEFVIRAGVYETPSDTLDEKDIIGPVGVKSSLSSDERVNSMKASFIDPDREYEPTETVLISPSAYIDTRDNGEELPRTIQLPMTNSWYMAQRIVLKKLGEANNELTLTVPCNLRACRFVPGQRINLEITERGWSPKVFKVLDWEFFDRGGEEIGVNVNLREDDSSAYADPDVADYNTLNAGVLTIVDPTPIPSIDTIPRGIKYGEGVWSIELTANEYTTGADDGEILVSRGRFILPDGTIRSLANDVGIDTPYEGSTVPPDGRFYLIWGATDPKTRFSASPQHRFGTTAAENAGLFTAIYDRISEQYYAVSNANAEIAFTPVDTDYIVATGTKTSASGGMDSLTALVSFEETVVPNNFVPAEFSDFETLDLDNPNILGTNKADMSLVSSDAFLGKFSLEIDYSLVSLGERRLSLTYGTWRNIPVRANRRHMLILRIKPTTADAAASTASYDAAMTLTSGSTTATAINGDDLTLNEWNEVRLELDASANSSTTAYLEIIVSNNKVSAGTMTCLIDGIQFIDVTDLPEFQQGVN